MDRKLIVGMVQDWGVALAIVIGVLVVWGALNPSPPRDGPAPDFAVSTLDGGTATLADLKGEVIVLNFWATWCGPCKAEIPELSAFAAANPDVTVVGISTDDKSPKRIASESAQLGISYRVLLDETDTAAAAYGVSGIPVTFILDGDRHIRYVISGATTRKALELAVAKAKS